MGFNQFMDVLADNFGSVAAGDHAWSAQITISASTPGAALDLAADVIDMGIKKSGMPAWPFVRAEIVRDDELDRQLAQPNFPEILGTTEVGDVLGVSCQRLHELRTAGRFPDPLMTLAATPIWLKSTIDSHLKRWDRKPGRPSKVMDLLEAR